MHEPEDPRALEDAQQVMINGESAPRGKGHRSASSGTGAALCTAVMLLLALGCDGRCNHSMILSSYRLLIVPELQSLSFTGPSDASKESSRCLSNKRARIVGSIYKMTEQFVCLSEGQQGNAMAAVVSKMGQLIRFHCGKKYKKNGQNAKPCTTGQKRKARRQMKTVQMLINCWQKLQSLYAQ